MNTCTRANIYNMGIRNSVLGCEDEISSGDMLMVVRNNYYWAEATKSNLAFIANGDRARVVKVRNYRDLYGFHFADVLLRFPDYDDQEMEVTVVLDSLTTESPALSHNQQEQLYNAVMEDYADVPLKADRIKKLKSDKYYNALQIKYAYDKRYIDADTYQDCDTSIFRIANNDEKTKKNMYVEDKSPIPFMEIISYSMLKKDLF